MCRLPNFTFTYQGVNVCLAQCINGVLNLKVLIGAFNQERALLGAISMIVKLCIIFAEVHLKLYYGPSGQHKQLQLQHQLIAFSDCDLIIANVEDFKYFVVVVTAVDSVVVGLVILRVQDYALSLIYNIIKSCILEDIIVHCIFYVFWV